MNKLPIPATAKESFHLPQGWSWTVAVDCLTEICSYRATLMLNGVTRCQLATTAKRDEDESVVVKRLAAAAQNWVAEYHKRQHVGDIGFVEIS